MIKSLLVPVFLFGLLPIAAQTFTSTVNQVIPDDGSIVSFEIPVSGLPDVIDTTFGLKTVCLNMTHTYTSDITLKLQSPDGKVVMLFAGIGGGGHDFIQTCLEGTGASLAAASAPFTGTFQSQGVLGNFNKGQNPNGVWTLIVHDTYAFADEGFLIDWSITFGTDPARPFIFTGSNLPIVKLSTLGQPIGDDPKVPVRMQIIDNGPNVRNYVTQTNYSYEGMIMTEWQGFTGPYYPKKNYDFELVDEQGNDLDTSILDMPKETDWIFKAEYLDHTLLKNSVTYEMARRMGRYAPRTRMCELVLDDEYIGLYVLTEKVKRDKNRVDIARLAPDDISGVDLTGGYIIEMNINNVPGDWNSPYPPINSATCPAPVEFKHVYPNSEKIVPEQRDYIRAYVDTFENALLAQNFADPVNGYRQYMDVGSFIDFLIVNEFSVNYDSYGRSTYLYKEKDTDGGKLNIGPPWDYDRAMDYYYPESTSGWVWEITHPYWPFPFWWSRMWEDEAYRKQLACRWTNLRQNTLSTNAFIGLIDTLHAQIDEAQERNFRVWNDLGNMTYAENIDSLKSFVTRRLQWIDNTLAAESVSIPDFYFPTDTLWCTGDSFDANLFVGNQYQYNWQPGPDTSVIMFPASGLYHLKATDPDGCYVRKPIEVTLVTPLDPGFNSQQLNNSNTWSFQPNELQADSYFWDFGDGNTTTVPSPTHQYANGGAYTVTLTVMDDPGCAAVSAQQSIQVTSGAREQTSFDGRISPNPFHDRIQLDFTNPTEEDLFICLKNEMGQQLISDYFPAGATTAILQTDQLPAGLYLLQITQHQQVYTLKMMHY